MKNKKKTFFYSYEVYMPDGTITKTGHGTFVGNPTNWGDALKELEDKIRKLFNLKEDEQFHLIALNQVGEVKE